MAIELIMEEKLKSLKERVLKTAEDGLIEENNNEEIEIIHYNPMPGYSIVDPDVIKLQDQCKPKRSNKEETERDKLRNAIALTNLPQTILNGGLHPNETPRLAFGLIGAKTITLEDAKRPYFQSGGFVLNIEKWNQPAYRIGVYISWIFLSVIAMFACAAISIERHPSPPSSFDIFDFFLLGGVFFSVISLIFSMAALEHENRLSKLLIPSFRPKVKTDLTIDVPKIPSCILNELQGPGPFGVLFETEEQGWKATKTDPIIFRIINIDGERFFEPIVGWSVSKREKESLQPI